MDNIYFTGTKPSLLIFANQSSKLIPTIPFVFVMDTCIFFPDIWFWWQFKIKIMIESRSEQLVNLIVGGTKPDLPKREH